MKDVEWVLVEMPLPRLQVLGASEQRFIYQIRWERDGISRKEFLDGSTFHNQIQFVGGAEWHLVRLAGLLRPLLQREWAARVAAINRLPEARLEAFLFGASRQALRALEPSLRDLQEGRCFYCDESLGNRAAVDHFIPWARHPDDAVENLVIADARCNGAKSDHLAAVAHLDRWDARARDQSTALADIASRHDWEQGDGRSLRTARAIYSRLAPAVPLWLRGRIFVPFDRNEFDRTLT